MTATIDRRVSALESQMSPMDSSLMVLFPEYGESEGDALLRAGHPPDAACLCVRFVDAPRSVCQDEVS
jgi:hypothetical protein